ncbi:MAG: hypothetical protein IPJ04_10340 [Candidatus Eisenbacteria bacterium]|nr:hypothetical protein [Candidatus Eisenbacteria bacterium]
MGTRNGAAPVSRNRPAHSRAYPSGRAFVFVVERLDLALFAFARQQFLFLRHVERQFRIDHPELVRGRGLFGGAVARRVPAVGHVRAQRFQVAARGGVTGVNPQRVTQQANRVLDRAELEARRGGDEEQARVVRRERQSAQRAGQRFTRVVVFHRGVRGTSQEARGFRIRRRVEAGNVATQLLAGAAQRHRNERIEARTRRRGDPLRETFERVEYVLQAGMGGFGHRMLPDGPTAFA